jgi:integrase
MAAFKNKDNGTWYVQFRYTDWKGERQQKLKRGFATKREALEWEREFLMEKQADVNMTFESFVALYEKDIRPKLKLNTWLTKESIIKKKILPYFAKRKLSEITAKDIMRWQNEIREMRDCHGKPLSKTYLKTVHNQLSAIFNHAARFYGLNLNPARQAGNMGAEERKEMLFWTREEYTKFSEAMMDKPLSFYAFEVLYWCGVREGELLALTPADFDFEKRTLTINKSYQRINKQDVITTPKTPKSNRVIQMPQFLCDELQDYLKQLYGVEPDSRMFPISKSYLHREMDRGCKQTGVKRIRIEKDVERSDKEHKEIVSSMQEKIDKLETECSRLSRITYMQSRKILVISNSLQQSFAGVMVLPYDRITELNHMVGDYSEILYVPNDMPFPSRRYIQKLDYIQEKLHVFCTHAELID